MQHEKPGVFMRPLANPLKLFFFDREEFFRFLLLSLHVCYIKNYLKYKIVK